MAFQVSSFTKTDDCLGMGCNAFHFDEGRWNGHQRVYDSFWAGGSPTPPVEGKSAKSEGNYQHFLELWRALAADSCQSNKVMDVTQGRAGSVYDLKPKYMEEQVNSLSPTNDWHETRPPDKRHSANASALGTAKKNNLLSLLGWCQEADEQLTVLASIEFDALQEKQPSKQVTMPCDKAREVSSLFSDQVNVEWLFETSASRGENDLLQHTLLEGKKPAGYPHEGFYFVLQYLGLPELLCMEQVCKPFRDAIRNDVFLWQKLRVDHPLNMKLTDEALISLSNRAQGYLTSVILTDCLRISDEAVDEVVVTNPMLTKLHLPGCKQITADAVVRMVRRHAEMGGRGLQQMRIRGLHGITKEHLQALKTALVPQQPPVEVKPQFYHNGHYSTVCDDERPIDVEACPRCGNARVVYDCTRQECQQKEAEPCRGCTSCIARCEECGTCIDDVEYQESFSLDLICSACWTTLSRCVECSRPGCELSSVDDFIRSPDTVFVCAGCQGQRETEFKFFVL